MGNGAWPFAFSKKDIEMKYRFLTGLMFCCTLVYGQNKISPNTRVLMEELKSGKQIEGLYRTAGEEPLLPVFVKVSEGADAAAVLERYGCDAASVSGSIATAHVPASVIGLFAEDSDVVYVQAGSVVRPAMNKARTTSFVDKVQAGEGLEMPFLGDGVVVGVIDTGFEYGHINFWNDDKTELRVKRVWDQNKSGNSPEGYDYGTEYDTTEEILQAEYDSNETHATHVLGIAAGSDKTGDNPYYGVAGNADIVIVSRSLTGTSVEIADAVKYIIGYAQSVKKPCVINISMGNHIGPHDGTSMFDVMMDETLGRGKLLVGAAGNEGAKNFHLSKTFNKAGERPVKTFIDLAKYTGVVDIWGDQGTKFAVEMHVFDERSEEVVFSDTVRVENTEAEVHSVSLPEGCGMEGYVRISTEESPLNGKPHAYVYVSLTKKEKNFALGMSLIPLGKGTVHAWADAYSSSLVSKFITGYTNGNSKYSIGEIGGTGNSTISVGAYVSSNTYLLEGSSKETSVGTILGGLASFSSKGPRVDGAIKPDITAPGSFICSSVSSAYDNTLIGKTVTHGGKKYYFGYMEGTSMSAPYVTGVLATWLQAYPRLNPELVKEIFKETAIRDDYTGELPEEGSSSWGQGKIDAWEGIKKAIYMCEHDGVESLVADKGGVMLAGRSPYPSLLFLESDDNVCVEIYSAGGMLVGRLDAGSVCAGDEVKLPADMLPQGYYVVKVTGRDICKVMKGF